MTFALRADDGYSWTSLGALARDNVAAPVLTHLSNQTLPNLRTALVLARTPRGGAADRLALIALLREGGTVVAASSVAADLGAGKAKPTLLDGSPSGKEKAWRVSTPNGRLVGVDGPVEALFADSRRGLGRSLWTRLFGTQAQTTVISLALTM